jgi:hypothetical protein
MEFMEFAMAIHDGINSPFGGTAVYLSESYET